MFIWKPRKKGGKMNTWAGRRAGARKDLGYIVIRIDYRLYRAHRLVWLYVHGRWPEGEIDHINGDPSDNRWANLRLATSSNQKMNARLRPDNTSGIKGVWYDKRRSAWVAEIWVNGKKHHIGQFATLLEAKGARIAAAHRLHGEFARHD
ncbi:MAG TPA: HNH endonuclease [Acetobacteraceae bacterium]|nr:HNH endonuclease [Acetobacteraceae bacterium]